jgi:hypothetical protein
MTTLSFSLLRSFLLPFVTKSHDDDETCGGTPCTSPPPYYPSCASALVGTRFRGSHSSDFYTCRF